MTAATDWQARVGDVWAEEWRRTDRSFDALSRHLDAAILAAAPAQGHVLDIGCGAGSTSLALGLARPALTITGVDLSPALIAVATDRAGRSDHLRFEAAAVETCGDGPRYDLLVSRHGVMFFADPSAAFTHLRHLARPGAALVFSCFAARSANRFATIADDLVGTPAPDPAALSPGPFAFADPGHVATLLTQSGWHVDSAARIDFAYRVGEGADPVADAADFLSRIGPAAAALRDAPPGERPAIKRELAALLAHYHHDAAVDLPAQAWIWRARAGERS